MSEMQIGSGNTSQGFSNVVRAVQNSGTAVSNAVATNTTTLANMSASIAQLSSSGSTGSQMDLSPVTSVLRRISADLTNLIRLTDSRLSRLIQAGGSSSQAAPAPQETPAERAARELRETEERRRQATQRRRDMLKRVRGRVMKYSGANMAGRGLRNVGRMITRATGSMFTWGTAIAAAFAYFVNSPLWGKFTELLADSAKDGGWLNTFIKFVQNIFKPLEGIQEDLLKGEFGKAADKIADFFISLMNRLIIHINDALGPFGVIDQIKTREVNKEEKKLTESANELSPETKMPGVGGLVDTSKEFAKNNPITPEMSELEAGLIKNATETRESLEAVTGFVTDSFIGDQFAYFGDYLNTQASKATGTMLKLKTMSDDQLADRQRELANITDEDYGEAGAMRLQMEVEELNKLGKSRMEVLAAFDKESQRRNDGGKPFTPDTKTSVTAPIEKAVDRQVLGPQPAAAAPVAAAPPPVVPQKIVDPAQGSDSKSSVHVTSPKTNVDTGVLSSLIKQLFN